MQVFTKQGLLCFVMSLLSIHTLFAPYQGGFTLGLKTKETPKSSSCISWEQNCGSMEFAQGFGPNVWKKHEVALMWHHFTSKSQQSPLKKTFSQDWKDRSSCKNLQRTFQWSLLVYNLVLGSLDSFFQWNLQVDHSYRGHCTLLLQGNSLLTPSWCTSTWSHKPCDNWGEPTRTVVPWRQGFRHSTRNECMGWFAQIPCDFRNFTITYISLVHFKTSIGIWHNIVHSTINRTKKF